MPLLRKTNKVDGAQQEPKTSVPWSLGLGEPLPVSALHGRSVPALLNLGLKTLSEVSAVAKREVGGSRRVAILGRPNVGKPSLLNKAVGAGWAARHLSRSRLPQPHSFPQGAFGI